MALLITATGPTVERSYVFPDADATILTTNAAVTVAQGGTGLATLTAHALYVGNGASAPTALAVGATGTVLIGNTGADASFSATPSVTSLTASTALIVGTNPAGVGAIRMAYSDSIIRRNNANNANWNLLRTGGFAVDDTTVGTSNALTVLDGTLVALAGSGALFPALKRSGTTILGRLADDSDYCSMQLNAYTANTSFVVGNTLVTSGQLTLGAALPTKVTDWTAATYGVAVTLGATDGASLATGRVGANVTANQWFAFKSRAATLAPTTVVVSGDRLLDITAFGADGTDYVGAASIRAYVDGTPGTNDMPGRLEFWTTADGSGTLVKRLTIDNAGLSTFAGAIRFDGTIQSGANVGIDASITTGSLVGKTITVSNGIITGFA